MNPEALLNVLERPIAFLNKTSIVKSLLKNENPIVKYFTRKPPLKPILICMGIGLLLTLFGLTSLTGDEENLGAGASIVVLLIGIVLLGVGFLMFVKGFCGRATEEEVDEFVQREIVAKQREHALKKLDLEWKDVGGIPPIELWGWNLGEKQLDCVAALIDVLGKDGIWRSPEVVCNSFYFSEETVHYCKWTNSVVLTEDRQTTDEIYYKDIVSVKQDMLTETLPDGSKARTETFSILNTGGGDIQCPAAGPVIEKAVSAFRAQLKAKKTA